MEGMGVRMKGWNKNAEAGSGEISGVRGGNKQTTSIFCLHCCCIHLLTPNETNLKLQFLRKASRRGDGH